MEPGGRLVRLVKRPLNRTVPPGAEPRRSSRSRPTPTRRPEWRPALRRKEVDQMRSSRRLGNREHRRKRGGVCRFRPNALVVGSGPFCDRLRRRDALARQLPPSRQVGATSRDCLNNSKMLVDADVSRLISERIPGFERTLVRCCRLVRQPRQVRPTLVGSCCLSRCSFIAKADRNSPFQWTLQPARSGP